VLLRRVFAVPKQILARPVSRENLTLHTELDLSTPFRSFASDSAPPTFAIWSAQRPCPRGSIPKNLRGIIGAYHRCVAEIVAGFGGSVARYMGDGVLIYFGYP